MVRFIPDPTGRFPQRPYYENDELEDECEAIIAAYYRRHQRDVPFPIPTDDLTKIIESEGVSLDLYAELDPNVDGCTIFRVGMESDILISASLSESERYENRLRTTLTHELAHVRFHGSLFHGKSLQLPLFPKHEQSTATCYRDSIVGAGEYDWLEWQAGFASTAMLMPRTKTTRVIGDWLRSVGLNPPIYLGTPAAAAVLRFAQHTFTVSVDAARIRLQRLGLILESAPDAAAQPRSLF